MPGRVDEQIARSAELLQRVSARQIRRRARSAVGRAKRAVKYAAIGVLLVMLATIGWGIVTPIGMGGFALMLLAMMAAVIAGVLLSAERKVPVEALRAIDLKALPASTERWLETQRLALPAPAVPLIDAIGSKLETLAPQLARLDPNEPAAGEIRKLLADHLPELVTGYQSIPRELRSQETNGRVPDRQLIDGLGVIDSELAQMTEQLAAGDLDKLATHNRYLELKYQEARELGGPG
jgi:hypothetical protein